MMSEKLVTTLIRLSFAAVAAAAVGLAPVTWAQETVPGNNKIDLTNLVFFKGDAYSVTYEDGVSTAATETTTVRKVGYGVTTVVNITTTSSGVYSSDAMTSPYIRYPGVFVSKLPASADETEGGVTIPTMAYWTAGRGWVATPFVTAGSFAIVSQTPFGATVINGTNGTCVVTATVARC
jgi:hypothetical protein